MADVFDFGVRLQELRKGLNLSQEGLAKRLHLTKSAISGYEGNTATPSVEVLTNLALLFNVSTDYLLGLDKRTALLIDGLSDKKTDAINKIVDIIKTDII